MNIQVKICGLSTPETIEASLSAGADYLGFTFFPRSPRHLSFETAAALAALVPSSALKVALTVDADNATFDALIEALQPDVLQLHGHETPERLIDLKARYGITLMKAIGVAEPDDPLRAAIYRDSADLLLFDAKPPKSMVDALPGGNGRAFDWSLIARHRPDMPWMLSGGLNASNVAEAIQMTGAEAVDVSSGVEDQPGRKTPDLIEAFIRAAKAV